MELERRSTGLAVSRCDTQLVAILIVVFIVVLIVTILDRSEAENRQKLSSWHLRKHTRARSELVSVDGKRRRSARAAISTRGEIGNTLNTTFEVVRDDDERYRGLEHKVQQLQKASKNFN